MVAVLDGENQPPLLSVTAVPERGEAPLEVQFEANAADQDGSVSRIAWDFGAGYTLTGPRQAKIYTAPGTHLVRVQAVDDQGLSSTVERVVFVSRQGEYPPHIFTTPPATARVGEDYVYQAAAVGTPALGWSLGKQVGDETTGAPEGMQVDPATGLVGWRPTRKQEGPVPVTLVVRNAAGADFQDFVVDVTADGSADEGCSCGGSRLPARWTWLLLLGWLALARRARRASGAG